MAKKLYTSFELPFANLTGGNLVKTFPQAEANDYIFQGMTDGAVSHPQLSPDNTAFTIASITNQVNFTTAARSLTSGTRGCFHAGAGTNTNYHNISYDLSQFSTGFYYQGHQYFGSNYLLGSNVAVIFRFTDGVNVYNVLYDNASGLFKIRNATTTTDLNTAAVSLSAATWYNARLEIDNAGVITAELNGVSVTHASGVSFASWTKLAAGLVSGSTFDGYQAYIDDIAVNDGSGAADNALPPTIRGYGWYDNATLNSNSGFSQVGGTGVVDNLQDGNDATKVRVSVDASVLSSNLSSITGHPMPESAGDFSAIKNINVYLRQTESTSPGNSFKAKIVDGALDEEKTISVPTIAGNFSVSIPDDGASEWSKANLELGGFDIDLTYVEAP